VSANPELVLKPISENIEKHRINRKPEIIQTPLREDVVLYYALTLAMEKVRKMVNFSVNVEFLVQADELKQVIEKMMKILIDRPEGVDWTNIAIKEVKEKNENGIP
jgi:hypothetical protein